MLSVEENMIIQVTTAMISLIAASVIVVAMLINKSRSDFLKSSYQRIIFSMSAAEILKSISIVTGPWSIPSGIALAPWGAGNMRTCRLNGFLLLVGEGGTQMYTAALCVYYSYKISRRRISEEAFADKFEWKIHIFIIFYNVFLAGMVLALDKIHAVAISGSFCSVAPAPTGCTFDPDNYGECLDFQMTRILTLIPFGVSIVINFIILKSMWVVIRHNKKRRMFLAEQLSTGSLKSRPLNVKGQLFAGYRDLVAADHDQTSNSGKQSEIASTNQDSDTVTIEGGEQERILVMDAEKNTFSKQTMQIDSAVSTLAKKKRSRDNTNEETISNDENATSSTATSLEDLSKRLNNEMMIQAICYVSSYFLRHFASLFFFITGSRGQRLPVVNEIWSFLFPLGGLFTIIIFTRPKVVFLQSRNPNTTYIQAFCLVLKNGIEVVDRNGGNHGNDNNRHHSSDRAGGLDSSIADCSNGAVNAKSASFSDENDLCYRPREEWEHNEGVGRGPLSVLIEEEDGSNSNSAQSNSMIDSENF